MPQVLVALGSNLGDSAASVEKALERLNTAPGFSLVAASSLHSTTPVGGPAGQGGFTNAAAIVEVDLSPRQVLTTLHGIEDDFGRLRDERWGPRTLDLDFLLMQERIVRSPLLSVPHPRMSFRPFMMDPAVEIAGSWHHPVLEATLAELAERLHKGDNAVLLHGGLSHDREWHARQLCRVDSQIQVAQEKDGRTVLSVGQPSSIEKPRLAIFLRSPGGRPVAGVPTLTLSAGNREESLFETRAALRCLWPDLGRDDAKG